MNICRKYWIAVLLLGTVMVHAQVNPQVLAKLAAASEHFRNAQADVSYDTYTRVVKQHDIETGTTYIERGSDGESMGAIFVDAGSSIPSKIVNYSGGKLQLYTPGTKQVDVFNAGANQARYESFLTLGFGGSVKDLQADWVVQDQGPETIDGVKTEKLDLVGKEQSVKNMFSHVTLWVDIDRGVSVKRVFYQPNGDMRTAVFSNIKLNGAIDKKPYAIDPKAKKVQH